MDPPQTKLPHRLCNVGIKLNWADLLSVRQIKLPQRLLKDEQEKSKGEKRNGGWVGGGNEKIN